MRLASSVGLLLGFAFVVLVGAAPQNASNRYEAASKNDAALKLRQDMRKLWSDHVIWTRGYVVAVAADAPDRQPASERLLKNQEDIGRAMEAYYGHDAGDALTALLKEHITIAVELGDAAKAGDKPQVKEIDARWQRNAEEMASFLAAANPNWSQSALSSMMHEHLKTTTDEVTARLEGKWEKDIKAFDAVYNHILEMADTLSDGIIHQFPDRF